jgi:hypothetical protein
MPQASAMLSCIADSNCALNAADQPRAAFMPFPAQTVSVGQLLANPFVIEAPAYQRSFAWADKEAGKLLDDIVSGPFAEAGARNGEYFLGAMLFIERPPASRLRNWRPWRVLEVVDGFQRLTTLIVLLCVLRDLDEDDGKPANARLLAAIGTGQAPSARPRLSVAGPEEAFFLAHVRAPGATRVEPNGANRSPAQERILQVRDHFVAALMGYDAAERRKLAEFVLDQCCVVQVLATDIDQAHRMFEVLNARGKPLARNDILKAELLDGVPAEQALAAKVIWEKAEARAGSHFEQLFSHIRAMYRRPDDKVISDIRQIAAEKGGAWPFIEKILQPSATIFDDILNARHAGHPQSASIAQYLRYLGWHSFSDWLPPAMLWWLERGEDVEGLSQFLRRLDRLALGVKILGIGGSKRARRFGMVALAIADGGDLDGPGNPLELTRPELKTIEYNLRDLHVRNAPAAKHLLLRLGDAEAGKPESATLPEDMTVEHVLPRKLGATSQWRGWHPDPEIRDRCTHSLGNLVLVTKAQNDRAGNLDFARKLEIYFNTPGAPIPILNQDLRGRADWRTADIKAREARLMRLIEELWDFDLPKLRGEAQQAAAQQARFGRGRKRA